MGKQHETFPYFNFFARDWLAGTLELTAEQRGMFVHMLASSWEQNPPCTLPDVDNILALAAGVSVRRWRKVGGPVRAKFDVIDGRLRNAKLWQVYTDMVAFRETKREAGKKGGAATRRKWQETQGTAHSSARAQPRAATQPPSPIPLEPSLKEGSIRGGKPSGPAVEQALRVIRGEAS